MRRFADVVWDLSKESVLGFVNDRALSHGAAMAFYAATSLAPILLIVVAIAGLVFGHQAAQLALSAEISGVMGPQAAEVVKITLQNASQRSTSTIAMVVGLLTLLVTASGVFGEMQLALNDIWKVEAGSSSLSRLVRARLASLGLVAALGFILLVSLVASTAIEALGGLINSYFPSGATLLSIVNGLVSFILIALLFGAIYKVLPDRTLKWRDVAMGALVTSFLFVVGKSLIGWYIATSAVASSYGAAGALIVVLLWVYYSAEIFLFGAEVTRAYSVRNGSRVDLADVVRPQSAGLVSPASNAASLWPPPSGKRSVWLFLILGFLSGFVAGLGSRRRDS